MNFRPTVDEQTFKQLFLKTIHNQENPYHPLVWIIGNPSIGKNTYIGGFSEINAKGARITIGKSCDIASFVTINVADSHLRCIGLSESNKCVDIWIGDCVFIGTHSAILGGAVIGHHSVIAAGTVVRAVNIPPYSLVLNSCVKPEYYRADFEAIHGLCNSNDSA